jgi:hypothetical protein
MKFVGFYNFKGGGTEQITGGANENLTYADAEDIISNNDHIFFSGQFTNLSRVLIHVTLKGSGSGQFSLHKHDLRAYESLNVVMIPLGSISVHVETGTKIGYHGMGVLWEAEDEDELAVMASQSQLFETMGGSPDFDTDKYARVSTSSATTTDLVVSGSTNDFALYKCTIYSAGANLVDLIWTDSSNGTIKYIGRAGFTGEGTFIFDFDEAFLRNPNRQGGKLRVITSTTAVTTIDVIGHLVVASQ